MVKLTRKNILFLKIEKKCFFEILAFAPSIAKKGRKIIKKKTFKVPIYLGN
jgi:hypothetical protein